MALLGLMGPSCLLAPKRCRVQGSPHITVVAAVIVTFYEAF